MGHEAKTEVPGARGDGKMSKVPLKKLERTSKAKHFRKITSIQGGGKVSPRKSVVQSACHYDVTSRVSDFQNGQQSVLRRDA